MSSWRSFRRAIFEVLCEVLSAEVGAREHSGFIEGVGWYCTSC